jgi:arylsulfatase A-like enzyme
MLISSCLEWVQKQRIFVISMDAKRASFQNDVTMDLRRRSTEWPGAIVAFIALSVSFVSDFASGAANQPSASAKPNIVFILADDLGYGDLGCYGQTKIKTPNIDRLASQGMRFTDFYAGSTVCAPSRCALMTGLHSGHGRIRGNKAGVALATNDVTLAEILKMSGYHTGLVGKWGLGDEGSSGMPGKKGFTEFFGYLNQTHAHDYYTDYLWRSDSRTGRDEREPIPQNTGNKKGLYTPDLFTMAATNFIRTNKPDQTNDYRPFFLYLAYIVPHANDEEGQRSGNGMQVPSDDPYSNEPWPQVEKNKAAMITRMDGGIGKLMELLQKLKLDENTVVFFSSDNGAHKEGGVDPKFFQSSGKLRGIKRDLYEGGIRVPMLVRWPGKIKPGQVSEQVWVFWDVLPTLAEIAGAKTPDKIDGISMLPTLFGQPQTNQHAFLYWEFHERGFQQAARMGQWKAVRPQADEPLELYNLRTDISESENVAQKNPDVVAKLDAYLKTARTDSEQFPIRKEGKKQGKKKTGAAAEK